MGVKGGGGGIRGTVGLEASKIQKLLVKAAGGGEKRVEQWIS